MMSKERAGAGKVSAGQRRRPRKRPIDATAIGALEPQALAGYVEQVSSLLRQTSDPGAASILISLARGALAVEDLARAVDQGREEVARRLPTLERAGLIAVEKKASGARCSLTTKGLDVARFLEGMIAREAQANAADVAIDPDLLKSLGEVLEDPQAWLRTPNTAFGGRRPLDLLGTPEEPILRDRIKAATLGMFS
jgi:DNA-binding transcriptional ArsR family regulator